MARATANNVKSVLNRSNMSVKNSVHRAKQETCQWVALMNVAVESIVQKALECKRVSLISDQFLS